jgi:hypothetical protein
MRIATILAAAIAASTAATALRGQDELDAGDFAGHWDRISALESFGNTPGGTRGVELAQSAQAPFTAEGRTRFDANKPGYGPRRQMERNDPLGRCEPMGLVRNLNVEIVAPHSTFEIVPTPGRILQFFEYRHDWREIWMDGRSFPASEDVYPKWNGYSIGRIEGDTLIVESVGFDDRSWLDKLGYPHSERMHVEERYRRVRSDTLELTVTIWDPAIYGEPWQSDTKRFQLNSGKAQSWDEQIYCIPAEETSFQQLIGTGNVID